jgi:hypothetical protein
MKYLFLATAALCFAQADSPVQTASLGLPNIGYQQVIHNTSGNVDYVCYARSTGDITKLPTISAATNANPASLTITAHGLDYQSGATISPSIFISGGTGAWAAINGLWIATITGANSMTIPVDSTAFGALAGTFVVTTRAVPDTLAKWAIKHIVYDSGNNPIWIGWAVNTGGSGQFPVTNSSSLTGGAPAFQFQCSAKTTYAYQ